MKNFGTACRAPRRVIASVEHGASPGCGHGKRLRASAGPGPYGPIYHQRDLLQFFKKLRVGGAGIAVEHCFKSEEFFAFSVA